MYIYNIAPSEPLYPSDKLVSVETGSFKESSSPPLTYVTHRQQALSRPCMPHIDSFTLEISQTSKRTIVSCASLTVSSIPRDGSTMTGGSREPSWEMRATLILDHAAQPSVYRVIDDDRFVEKDISIEAGLVSLMKFIDSFVRFFYFFFKRV